MNMSACRIGGRRSGGGRRRTARRGRRSRGGTGFGNAGPIREIRTPSATLGIPPLKRLMWTPYFRNFGRLVLCSIKIDFSDWKAVDEIRSSHSILDRSQRSNFFEKMFHQVSKDQRSIDRFRTGSTA
jgi:hypothetical protein